MQARRSAHLWTHPWRAATQIPAPPPAHARFRWSYLLKLILTNVLESGKAVICLDPEHEVRQEVA